MRNHYLILLLLLLWLFQAGFPSPAWTSSSEALYLELQGRFELPQVGIGMGVAVSQTGEVIVNDPSKSRLWQLDRATNSFKSFVPTGLKSGSSLHPAAVAFDQNNRLWVTDTVNHQVVLCDISGKIIAQYDRNTVPMEKPVIITPLSDGRMAVWDAERMVILYFNLREKTVQVHDVSNVLTGHAVNQCIPDNSGVLFCLDRDTQTLLTLQDNTIIQQKHLRKKGTEYTKISYMEFGPQGYLYLADSAGKRIFYLDRAFREQGAFLLYRHLFHHPGKFTFQTVRHDKTATSTNHAQFWLIDEAKESLLYFRVRRAISGIDYSLLSEEYLSLGLYQETLKMISRAAELGQDNPAAQILRGRAYYGLGQYEQALVAFIKAAVPTHSSEVEFWQGNSLFRLGRYKEARTAYLEALQEIPGNTETCFNLGQTFLALQQSDEAIQSFSTILDKEPDNLPARISLGRAYLETNRCAEAIPIFAEIIEKKTGAGREARHYLGICYLKTDRYKKAVQLLELAAGQGPFFREAMENLAVAYQLLGKHALQKKTLAKVQKLKKVQNVYFLAGEG